MPRVLAATATAAALLFAATASAVALTPAAEAIVASVKANSDVNAICSDRGRLTSAVKTATISLMKSGKLSGNPRPDAMAAGRYIAENCGKL